MACNVAMSTKHPDAKLIEELGGPAAVARLLDLDPSAGGVQRVQNWTVRGIPLLLRFQRTDVFGPAPTGDREAA